MGWVINATPWALYPRERPGTHCIGGWVGPGAGLEGCGKSRLHRVSIPDLPARSESLYRLSYTGSPAFGSNGIFLITSLRASHMPMSSGL